MDSSNNEEPLEAVTLSPEPSSIDAKDDETDVDELLKSLSSPAAAPPRQTAPATDDPWDVPTAIAAAEAEAAAKPPKPPTDTDVALSHLRSSTSALTASVRSATSNIDNRLGLSQTTSQLTQSARNIDRDLNLSRSVAGSLSAAGSALGGFWSNLDSTYSIKERASNLTQSVNETAVKPLSSKMEELAIGEKLGVKDRVASASSGVKEWDEEHKVTATAVEGLATGVNLLAKSIAGQGGVEGTQGVDGQQGAENLSDELSLENNNAAAESAEVAEQKDDDGLPTSFQKK